MASGANVRIAVIGDFGFGDTNELSVADLVKTNFQPDLIVTTGDNNYCGASEIDRCIGQYYHSYIGNYQGNYGSGATSNRFFPALGNHDYYADGYATHLTFFTLPGNERYYPVHAEPVEFFICNSDVHEPDGTWSTSVQAFAVSNWMAQGTAPWRIPVIHDPPFSSSISNPSSDWPFKEWGAQAVLSGNGHHYERLEAHGIPYFVNGAGGATLFGYNTIHPASRVRYDTNYGAMLITADETVLKLEFYSVAGGGTLIDSVTLVQPRLSVRVTGAATIRMAWTTNAHSFVLEQSPDLSNWTPVDGSVAVENQEYALYASVPNAEQRFYRLRK